MIKSDLDLLKKLSLVGWTIGRERYFPMVYDLFRKLKIPYKKSDFPEEDMIYVEFIRRKYKIGGKKLLDGISVLKSIRGGKKKIKNLLGE